MNRGFCTIGIDHAKDPLNIGTLWRSAHILGATYIFTIGRRYKRERSDTMKTWKTLPLFHYERFDDFKKTLPKEARIIAIETSAERMLADYTHPQQAVYLLGAEDHGLTQEALEGSHDRIRLPGERCLNVATVGSIVLYDRLTR